MALRLTPDNLEGAYEYLRACEPFCRWKLPHADEIEFHVTRHPRRYGHMIGYCRSRKAIIGVSEVAVGSSRVLIETMAHEMIHLHQHLRRTETAGTQHNAEFLRFAKIVSAIHCFDPKAFV